MVERRLASHEFESHNAKTPQIDSHIVVDPFEYLWCDVVESAAVCFSALVADGRPAEIAQFVNVLQMGVKVHWR